MNNTVYFAYGSNMNSAQMEQRCPRAEYVGIARLDGWQFELHERGIANIKPAPGDNVWGVLWMLTDEHCATLDRFEGIASQVYRRETITVITPTNETLEALVYVGENLANGKTRDGYIDTVLVGAREHNLPTEYLQRLAAETH